jgi:hypothetical protein
MPVAGRWRHRGTNLSCEGSSNNLSPLRSNPDSACRSRPIVSKCPRAERSGDLSGKLASDAGHRKRPARRCKMFFGGQQQQGFPKGKLTQISPISVNLSQTPKYKRERVLAENTGAGNCADTSRHTIAHQMLDARARPATPGAGVLPNFGVRVYSR